MKFNYNKVVALIYLLYFVKFANAQNIVWANSFGSTGNDNAKHTATDTYGNVYSCGSFSTANNDFDPSSDLSTLPAGNLGEYIFIQKVDSFGDLLWAKSFTSTSGQAQKIKIDPNNNIYISGFHTDTLSMIDIYGDTLSIADGHVFGIKLNPNGDILWAKSFGEHMYDVEFDSHGNIFTIGFAYGSADFDPSANVYIVNPTPSDGYLHKMDSMGNFIWVKLLGNYAVNLHIDEHDNMYLNGGFSSNASGDFDPGTGVHIITLPTTNNTFISKLNSDGNFIWAKATPLTIVDAIPTNNYLYTIGLFQGTVDIDLNSNNQLSYTAVSGNDMFISKIDSIGNLIWAKQLGSQWDEQIEVGNADEYGNLYIAGHLLGPIDIDPGPGTHYLGVPNALTAFFAKFNSNGEMIWAERIGNLYFSSLEMSISGFAVSGYYQDTMSTYTGGGAINFTAIGGYDNFVIKIGQNACTDLSINFDSLSNITCNHLGFADLLINGGTPPYDLIWNTTPTSSLEYTEFDQPGVYQITVADTVGCSKSRELLIDGHFFSSGIELDVNLVAGNFRSGFQNTITIDAANRTCNPSTGLLQLILDSLSLYQSALPSPSYISGDTLRWDFSSITYNNLDLLIEIQTLTSSQAVIGDTVALHISIQDDVNSDIIPANNNKIYHFPIINAYDPNDKSVYPQGICDEHYILKNQPLTYTVRFQNTGNAEAVNIFILDSICTNLDIHSTRIKGQSHPSLLTEILPNNILKFSFDNIMLPDSNTSEPLSHGYVIFEISPESNQPNGTQVNNSVGIYFDYNPPVYTNTTSNTLIDVLPICYEENNGINNSPHVLAYAIYPNPARNEITLRINNISSFVNINILDTFGKSIYISKENQGPEIKIPFVEMAPGIYFVKFETEGRAYITKIIKSE